MPVFLFSYLFCLAKLIFSAVSNLKKSMADTFFVWQVIFFAFSKHLNMYKYDLYKIYYYFTKYIKITFILEKKISQLNACVLQVTELWTNTRIWIPHNETNGQKKQKHFKICFKKTGYP